MNKKLLAIVLALILALGAVSAYALTKDEAAQQADKIVDTTTDKSLVTSPFIGIIANVQNSVVGINNYQNYTYSSFNNPGSFGFGFGFGYGSGSRSRDYCYTER